MISRSVVFFVLAGILSGLVFSGFTDAMTVSLSVIYLPVLLLLLPGLSYGMRPLAGAGIIAAVIAGLLGGADTVFIFLLLVLLPSLYFTSRILRYKGDTGQRQWYPVLYALTELTAITAIYFMICVAWSGSGLDGNNLQTMVTRQLNEGLSLHTDPQAKQLLHWLAGEGFYVFMACSIWLWVLLFYGVAVLAQALLTWRKLNLRPALSLTAGPLPLWLLGMLLIAALLAWLGKGQDHFIGVTVSLLLLLPYFLYGLSLLHSTCKRLPGGKLWLILFYVVLILLPWLAFLLIGAGLYLQLAEMLDKARKIG